MIHWSPKSERTSVQNCHSYLTYIFHIITTLGDSIFQTLQRIMRDAFASRGIIEILQWALLIFIITTSGDLFYFYLRASLLLPSYMIFMHQMMHNWYKLFFVKSCIIVSRKTPTTNYNIFVSLYKSNWMRAKLVFDFTHFTNIFCISIKPKQKRVLLKKDGRK